MTIRRLGQYSGNSDRLPANEKPDSTVTTTAPTNPQVGDIWLDSDAASSALNSSDYATLASPALTGGVTVTAASASSIPLTVKGAASQSANLLNVRNSDDSSRFVVAANGIVGITSTSIPQTAMNIAFYSATGNARILNMDKSRGTEASPAVVQDGDDLGVIQFRGYSGAASAFVNAAQIRAQVDGTPDSAGDTTDMPGRLVFYTTPDGTSNLTERMRITSAGDVGIGTTPSYKLHMYDATDSTAYISSDGVAQVTVARASTDATGPYVVMRKARGTQASPSIVSSGDLIGGLAWQALDTTVYRNAAQILCEVDATPGASDMPARLRFLITPDGTATMSERMRIDNAGLITGTGDSLGAWTSYTPTLTGVTTDPTLGTGSTAEGNYVQIGKIVHVYLRIVFGTSGTSNGSGNYSVSLPVTAKASGYNQIIGIGEIFDISVGVRKIVDVYRGSTTTLQMRYPADTTGNLTTTAATAPWTWAASDAIYLAFSYEAA